MEEVNGMTGLLIFDLSINIRGDLLLEAVLLKLADYLLDFVSRTLTSLLILFL